MKKFTLLFALFSTFCFSQSEINGTVLDETDRETLAYATIKILGSKDYTITNEDGRFELNFRKVRETDSLEIRFLGYATKKVSALYFKANSKLYLRRNISQIERVEISQEVDKNYVYNLLFSLIKKYRKQK